MRLKNQRLNNIKVCFLVLIVISNIGCATYERRINLTPQNSISWKKASPRYVKSNCNEGEVEVSPIIKEIVGAGYAPFFIPIPFRGEEGIAESNKNLPSMFLKVYKNMQIQSCDLSFVSLDDKSTDLKIKPVKVETHKINDDHTTYCYYYFESNDLSSSTYNLNISKEVLNCNLEPILYKQENIFEYLPMQMM